MAVPERVKVGSKLTATFLNFARDFCAAEPSMVNGILGEKGNHFGRGANPAKAEFEIRYDSLVPAYSAFRIKQHTAAPWLILDPDGTSGSPIYTNGGNPQGIFEAKPYPIVQWKIYELLCDATNLPAAGDLAELNKGTYTLHKGGAEFLCVEDPDADNVGKFLALPAVGGGQLKIGFVINADIGPRTTGEVELYEKDDAPTGTLLTVYNPHDVTFYQENTGADPHPADRVLIIDIVGYPEPVIFPFLLSECEELDPIYTSEDV